MVKFIKFDFENSLFFNDLLSANILIGKILKNHNLENRIEVIFIEYEKISKYIKLVL